MEVFTKQLAWAALCITVLVMSGSTEGASLLAIKAANVDASNTYDFTMDITNRIYTDSLLNPLSNDYVIMYEEVSSVFYSVYGCSTCDTHAFYQGVTSMTFSNNAGSVVVQATIRFDSEQTNSMVIKYVFLKAISGRNAINGLEINPDTMQVNPGPTSFSSTPQPTTTPTITLTTTPTTTPTPHTLTCDPFFSTNSPMLYIIMSCLTSTPTTTPMLTTTSTTTPTTPMSTTTPTTTPTTTMTTITRFNFFTTTPTTTSTPPRPTTTTTTTLVY